MQKMNIGLIGCGRVSELHMQAYKNIKEANVVAVSDINSEKAKAFAQRYGIKKIFTDYLQLLEIKDLDYVDVCTPTLTHSKIACEAANFGHNVLLEKPMARTTGECDKIINAVTKNGTKLSIFHNQLFLPLVMRAKAMVDSGEFPLAYFGVLVRESAELIDAPSWTYTAEQGGVLWETGYHCAYLQLSFLGDIKELSAVGVKMKHQVYDHFIVQLRSPNQVIGIIDLSWLAQKSEKMFELISPTGKQIKILDYDYPVELPEKRPKSFLQGFYWDQKSIIKKWIKSQLTFIRYHHLLTCLPQYIYLNMFINSIKNDTDPPVKPEDGRKTLELLECIEESLNKNQPIKIKSAGN